MKVLIADRSSEIRSRIRHMIIEYDKDSEVFETASNKEASYIAFDKKPNVVITELDLVDGSGLTLLSEIHDALPYTVIIVFTHLYQTNIELISKKLGADYYLAKPGGFVDIKHIIKDISNSYLRSMSS